MAAGALPSVLMASFMLFLMNLLYGVRFLFLFGIVVYCLLTYMYVSLITRLVFLGSPRRIGHILLRLLFLQRR